MTTLSCQEIRERILDGDQDAALHAHVEGCAECAAVLAAMGDLDADLEALPKIDAPDALVEATLARVRDESTESTPMTVGSPSLLAAAFAVLTSALGALITAPLVALHWLLGVGTQRKDGAASIEDRGKEPAIRPRLGFAPAFALATALIGIIAFSTFSRFGMTVKTKTRGAESVVNGLPTASDEEASDWWSRNMDAPNAPATAQLGAPAAARQQEAPPATAVDGRFAATTDTTTIADSLAAADLPAFEQTEISGSTGYGTGHGVPAQGGTFGWDDQQARDRGDLAGEDITLAPTAPMHHAGPMALPPDEPREHEAEERPAAAAEPSVDGLLDEASAAAPHSPEVRARIALRSPRGEAEGELEGGRGRRHADGDDGVAFETQLAEIPAAPTYWELAQATTGLTFASSQSWWANTYVPGDARLRVLHARLAASPATLSGSTLSALALAELASPTTPAVAAPTDRALALGVHADTTAIEGPTRVRLEIALRAIDQAAGRRGALRIALVVDARNGLGAEETAHLRALLASLSHSLSPRDRVILTAAGPGGGTLVPLGVLRHGQVEVALRHLADASSITMDVPPTSLDAALASGLEAVAVDDDGAGLALLVTPDGAHDAAVDQALHLGAVAGVPTTSIGIGTAASTASLDAIALAGEGRRRVVLSDDDAARAVREELSAASRLVARALRVRVRLADGVQLIDVVGSHSLDADETRRTRESERAIDQELARRLGIGQDRDDDDSGVRILVPSFYAGDSHTIVLDLLVTRPGPVADVDVRFKDLVRLGNGTASSSLALEAGTEPRGPHQLRVVASFVGHEVAAALDDAADAIERRDFEAATARLTTVRELIDQARGSVEGLASLPSMNADALLLDRFLGAIDAVTDVGLVASSLHYAAARRIVIPQLQASSP